MWISRFPMWRQAAVAAALLATLAAAGCREYKVETRIDPDGSGQRLTTIDAEPDLSADKRALLGLKSGWSEVAIEKDGKPVIRFTRQKTVGANGWSRLTPDIYVLSDPKGRAELSTHVSVECGPGDAGRRCVYRETIAWRDLRETIADAYADYLDRALSDSVRGLDRQARAEIRGLMHGAVLLRWDSLTEAEGHEHDAGQVIDAVAREAGRIAGGGRSPEKAARVTQIVRRVCLDPKGGGFNSDPLATIPGVELSVDSSLEMRVTLPGKIVESNADEIKDRTAIWRIDLSRTLQGDIVLRAEADLGR